MNRFSISRFPIVAFQNSVLEFLFDLRHKSPDLLVNLFTVCANKGLPNKHLWEILKAQGLPFSRDSDVTTDQAEEFARIVTERVSVRDEIITIEDSLRSIEFHNNRGYQTREEFLRDKASREGQCAVRYTMRTQTAAHPAALLVGDVLESGEKILSRPRVLQEWVDGEYFEGILVHLSAERTRRGGTWEVFPKNYVLALSHAVDPAK